jgi:hypothetical protein
LVFLTKSDFEELTDSFCTPATCIPMIPQSPIQIQSPPALLPRSMTHSPKGVMKDGIRYFMCMGSRGFVKAVYSPVVVTFMLGSSVADGLSYHDVVTGQIKNGETVTSPLRNCQVCESVGCYRCPGFNYSRCGSCGHRRRAPLAPRV